MHHSQQGAAFLCSYPNMVQSMPRNIVHCGYIENKCWFYKGTKVPNILIIQ